MVRLVDESGAPCALHLAVRDASGEPILELRADSAECFFSPLFHPYELSPKEGFVPRSSQP